MRRSPRPLLLACRRSLLAQLVAYNHDLHLFSAASIAFDFSNSGSVKASSRASAAPRSPLDAGECRVVALLQAPLAAAGSRLISPSLGDILAPSSLHVSGAHPHPPSLPKPPTMHPPCTHPPTHPSTHPQVSHRIETARVELYLTPTDKLRLAMELLLMLCIAYMAYGEARGLWLVRGRAAEPGTGVALCLYAGQRSSMAAAWELQAGRRSQQTSPTSPGPLPGGTLQAARGGRSPLAALSYFSDAWRLVDFCSTALLLATAALWVVILVAAARFRISLRWAPGGRAVWAQHGLAELCQLSCWPGELLPGEAALVLGLRRASCWESHFLRFRNVTLQHMVCPAAPNLPLHWRLAQVQRVPGPAGAGGAARAGRRWRGPGGDARGLWQPAGALQ